LIGKYVSPIYLGKELLAPPNLILSGAVVVAAVKSFFVVNTTAITIKIAITTFKIFLKYS